MTDTHDQHDAHETRGPRVRDGGPPVSPRVRVVLVHGTRFDATSWDPYLDLLPGVDVVAVDLPGHGTRAGVPYTTEAALAVVDDAVTDPARHAPQAPPCGPTVGTRPTDDVGAVGRVGAPGPADHAGEVPPVVLVGASLGGYVAASYAQAHPDRLAGLVLVGASADPGLHPRLRGVYTGFARLLPVVGTQRMAVVANAIVRRLGADPDRLPDAAGYAATPAAWAAVMAGASVSQLAEVTCPIHLVSGQFDQLGIDRTAYAAAARRARSVTIRVVPRATHMLPITHPAPVAAAILDAVAAAR